jgi:hypothetical protein
MPLDAKMRELVVNDVLSHLNKEYPGSVDDLCLVTEALASALASFVERHSSHDITSGKTDYVCDVVTLNEKKLRVVVCAAPEGLPWGLRQVPEPLTTAELEAAVELLKDNDTIRAIHAFRHKDGTVGAFGDPLTGGCQLLIEVVPEIEKTLLADRRAAALYVKAVSRTIGVTDSRAGLIWYMLAPPEEEAERTKRLLYFREKRDKVTLLLRQNYVI